jgi:drug/metabolite transporter (DMT)-like permease
MNSKHITPALLFFSFCALIALRDTLIDKLGEALINPLYIVFVFCASATAYSWLAQVITTKETNYLSVFQQSSKPQRLIFIKLSIATFFVYLITVYGILKVSAGIINFIEYGLMPSMTLFLALKSINENISKQQIIATFIGLVGVLFFTFIHDDNGRLPHGWEWILWITLIAISAYLTSLCSLYQKQLVNAGLSPQSVLLYRFPLATIVSGGACIILKVDFNLSILPQLLLISLLTVFLPLWLLCYAFMKESLGRFSIYLLFIPVFTVVIGALFKIKRFDIYQNNLFIIGSLIIIVSFLVFEGAFIKRKKC